MPTFKISRASRLRLEEAVKRIEEPAAALMAASEAYNKAVSPLRELACSIENDWQATWDKRSEHWQESSAGQSVAATIIAWAALAETLEDIEIDIPGIVIPD